jgi:hypothetical protein
VKEHPAGRPAGKEDIGAEKKSTEEARPSISTSKDLESCLRAKMRGSLEDRLEAEVDELLGRGRWRDRRPVCAAPRYRNGTGSPELSR